MGIACTSKKTLKICIYKKKVVSLQVKIRFMKKVALVLLIGFVLIGCAKFKHQRMDGAVAEYRGEIITQAEIASLTAGLAAEDSARVAERYIRQWASNILVWQEAKALNTKEIERKVADYHRSLCLHEWEQRMVNYHMSQQVEDSMVVDFYEANRDHFVLHTPTIKGILLVIPNGAPNMNQLKKHIAAPLEEENIEWVEKYAYQYATNYELFVEDWKTGEQLLQYVPFEKTSFSKLLKQKTQIEVQDSLNTYLLQVTSVCHAGDYAPLDYVRSDIEQMLLSQRQVDFLHSMRDQLYRKALEQGELKVYSSEN